MWFWLYIVFNLIIPYDSIAHYSFQNVFTVMIYNLIIIAALWGGYYHSLRGSVQLNSTEYLLNTYCVPGILPHAGI